MYDTFIPAKSMTLIDFVRSAKACTRTIEPTELLKRLRAKEDLLLVDVRESAEFEAGHIGGARLIPRGLIEAAADPSFSKCVPELVSARDKPVVVYCATGGRAAMAAAVLQMMGFRDVLNLDGGFSRWAEEGLQQQYRSST